MNGFNPFFINSNICLKSGDIANFDTFMKTIAGNTGNSYITYALIKALGLQAERLSHISCAYTYDFGTIEQDIEFIRSSCSHLFLILQDQIRIAESYGLKLPYQRLEYLIEKAQKPLVIMGLGANCFSGFDASFYKSLSPDLVRFLKCLSAHCLEIGVRGNFTAEVLNQLGIKNVRVIGCPSFFETGANRMVSKTKDISLGDILLTHSSPVLSLKENHQICQDYQEENIIRVIAFNEYKKIRSLAVLEKLCGGKYHVFSNMEDWKSFVSQFKFAFGERLHGSILALNAGVPSLCTNGDSRAREMCEFLHIPYFPHINENTDVLKLYEECDVDSINNNYPTLFNNFCDFIKKNVGITPFEKSPHSVAQPSLLLNSGYNLKFLKLDCLRKRIKNIFCRKNLQ